MRHNGKADRGVRLHVKSSFDRLRTTTLSYVTSVDYVTMIFARGCTHGKGAVAPALGRHWMFGIRVAHGSVVAAESWPEESNDAALGASCYRDLRGRTVTDWH